MRNGEHINNIVSNIEKLDYKSKINVLAEIVKQLKKSGNNAQPLSVTNLRGLGKKIWKKTDTDSYLTIERESWE